MNKPIKTMMAIACCAGSLMAADGKAGHAAYDASCKGCHGATGAPSAAIAGMMKVEMRSLGSAEVQALSDADMKKIIVEGKGKMKPVATAHKPDDIVAYIRTFGK